APAHPAARPPRLHLHEPPSPRNGRRCGRLPWHQYRFCAGVLLFASPSLKPRNLRKVTTVDWLILAFTVLLAFYGYLQGFIVGLLSLIGFALGAFLGTRLAPLLLPSGSHSQYAPLFGLVGALLAGGVLASGFEGVGVRARSRLRLPGLRALDGLLGAA